MRVRETWSFSGRLVLLPERRALLEIVRLDGAGKPTSTERTLWTEEAMHQFRLERERKEHIIWPTAAKDRGRLPAVLALPFFWNLSVDGLRLRYNVGLVKQDAETWILRIIPRTDVGRSSFSKALLQLDRATYLPRQYLLINPDGKNTKHFHVTAARRNEPIPQGLMEIDDVGGWKVIRTDEANIAAWLFRLFKPDLIP